MSGADSDRRAGRRQPPEIHLSEDHNMIVPQPYSNGRLLAFAVLQDFDRSDRFVQDIFADFQLAYMVVDLSILHCVLGQIFVQEIFHACLINMIR